MITRRAFSVFPPVALTVVALGVSGCHGTPTSALTGSLNGKGLASLCEVDLHGPGADPIHLRPENPMLAGRYPRCRSPAWCAAVAEEEEGATDPSIAEVYSDGSCRIPPVPT